MKKLLVLAVIVGALLSAGFGVFLEPLLYTLTPLQRYYLGTYLLSSWKAGDAAARTEVRWVWKIKPEPPAPTKPSAKAIPKFQYELATEDDVVAVPARERLWSGDRLPFTMSRKAELDGWSAVVWRTPVTVGSAQLNGWLQHDFFDGEPAWRFFLQPLVLLLSALVLMWIVRRERAAYYQEHVWSAVPFWRHLIRETVNAGSRFQKRLERRKAPPSLPAPVPVRVIETSPVKRLPVPVEAVSKPVPQPVMVPQEPLKAPVQPALWDESKGLE